MTIGILGKGWITPVGRGLEEGWTAIQQGSFPPVHLLQNPKTGIRYQTYQIPPEWTAEADSFSRLRRSGIISRLSFLAVKDALADAGLTIESLRDKRTAVIFATSNGGVNYTCRFFTEVAEGKAGSPLLFPETVYNAPASHIAAYLETDGTSLTFVGDAAASMAALKQGGAMLESGEAQIVVVVAAEETDWITCDAYGIWKLAKNEGGQKKGAIFSEGAAAVVLGPSDHGIETIHSGRAWTSRKDYTRVLSEVLSETLSGYPQPDLVVDAHCGGRFDDLENGVLSSLLPGVLRLSPAKFLGQSLAVSGLQQIIVAELAMEKKLARSVLVSLPGFAGQSSAVLLTS